MEKTRGSASPCAPFCLSIHQVREKHNAIWLFVVAINVVVAPPVSFNTFSSPFFSVFFFGLSRLYFGGRVIKETGRLTFLLQEQSNHTATTGSSFPLPSGRPSPISRFLATYNVRSSNRSSRNYITTDTYQHRVIYTFGNERQQIIR